MAAGLPEEDQRKLIENAGDPDASMGSWLERFWRRKIRKEFESNPRVDMSSPLYSRAIARLDQSTVVRILQELLT